MTYIALASTFRSPPSWWLRGTWSSRGDLTNIFHGQLSSTFWNYNNGNNVPLLGQFSVSLWICELIQWPFYIATGCQDHQEATQSRRHSTMTVMKLWANLERSWFRYEYFYEISSEFKMNYLLPTSDFSSPLSRSTVGRFDTTLTRREKLQLSGVGFFVFLSAGDDASARGRAMSWNVDDNLAHTICWDYWHCLLFVVRDLSLQATWALLPPFGFSLSH